MTTPSNSDRETVAIIGAGSIGIAFAVLFAKAGFEVRVFDPVADARRRGSVDARDRLRLLADHQLLGEAPSTIATRISFPHSVEAAVRGADLVQECAPENVELKTEIFSEVARFAQSHTVLASSSSAIVPSRMAENLDHATASRLVVGHPGNPPYLLPVIEVVPSPRTDVVTTERAEQIYRRAGLRPVVVRREVEGFVFNRLQGALLREAYCLLRDGVASVDDIDEVVRSGLGPRWSIIGPFETVDLNTRGGIESHATKMGPAYARMGAERGQNDPWTPDLVERATAERRALLILENWEERVHWRDEQLIRLLAARNVVDAAR
ncbi:3-hydroxyacyl-CoA dehydrogenase [Rhodococcus artemisiae]|uniref:3-hydroxyacyl-CoA dehydrogenase n=1 Tax=Rhodococcus artemisiae TaxID=714159 RepID=A0ABU7LKQ9_9NOCA|nr:3-hydroxyacyl-CoA dehydrogenase [Rhodococcus artemisiae]MEE2062163.1 3-hydroxyacyl-CoA dehydrogenase [Rhodococcus artemisiae]